MLADLIVLALVNIFWAGAAKTRQYGTKWNMSPRDGKMPELHPVPACRARAQVNLFETLPFFTAALLGALRAGHEGWKTEQGSYIYTCCSDRLSASLRSGYFYVSNLRLHDFPVGAAPDNLSARFWVRDTFAMSGFSHVDITVLCLR